MSYLLSIAETCGLNILLALSVYATFMVGQFSLAQVGFMSIGAYTTGVLIVLYGFPLLPSLLIAAALCACIGLVVGYPCLRIRGIYLAMATVAHRFDLGLLLAFDRQHDDRHGRHLPDAPAQLHAVHVGHVQIGDHELGRPGIEVRQRRRPLGSGSNLIPLAAENGPQHAGNLRLVVDDEHACAVVHAGAAG